MLKKIKNIAAYGFYFENQGAIQKLVNDKNCDLKLMVTSIDELSKNNFNWFDIESFKSDIWLKKYDEKIKYYSDVDLSLQLYNSKPIKDNIFMSLDVIARKDEFSHFFSNFYMCNVMINFFYGLFLKEKIDLVLFSNVPHVGEDFIMYSVAKFLNIPTIILFQLPVYPRILFMKDIDDFGSFEYMNRLYNKSDYLTYPVDNIFEKDLFYMKNLKIRKWTRARVLAYQYKKIISFFRDEKAKRKVGIIKKQIAYLKKLKNIEVYNVDYNCKYVYFPLHLQPELTTSCFGSVFVDQLMALEIISKIIPDDWKIYVKENPKQTFFYREGIFFSRLTKINKVVFVNREENTYQLLKKSQFVATITGTVAWESITGGKPALVFGKTWFEKFPGIFVYDGDFKLSNILNYKIDHQELTKSYSNLLSSAQEGLSNLEYKNGFVDFSYDKDKNNNNIVELLQKIIADINDNYR